MAAACGSRPASTSSRVTPRPWLSDAENLDLVSVGVAPGGLMDQLMRRQAALIGRLLVHRIQLSSIDAACRVVAAGLGLAVLPRKAAVPHAGAGRLAKATAPRLAAAIT